MPKPEEVADAINKANTEAVKAVAKTSAEAAKAFVKSNEELLKAAQSGNRLAQEQIRRTNEAVEKGVKHAQEQADKLVKDAKWNLDKAGHDVQWNANKAGRDFSAEAKRFGGNVQDLVDALHEYAENEFKSTGTTLSNAERRLREGKVVDALWGLSVEPAQHTSDNAATAVMESEYLNTIAQVAATAYGGPAGAAAYAAWLTLKQTGNPELALKAGILSYATSAAFGKAGKMSSATLSDEAKKVAVTAAIGGLAVAAAGGDEVAIQQGFVKAGAMVLVKDGYKAYTKSDLDARSSKGDAYCMTAVEKSDCSPPDDAYTKDANGNRVVDMTKVDPRVPHVGIMSGADEPHWYEERGAPMTLVSRVPGMNAMALFHDQWMIQWGDPNVFTTVGTIIPAVVLTYTGTGATYYEHLQKTVAAGADQGKVNGVAPSSTPLPAAASASEAVANLQDSVKRAASTTVSSDSVAFTSETALASVNCALKDGKESSVVADYGASSGSECRVVELASTGSIKVAGTAATGEACLKLLDQSVQRQLSSGASCFYRSAVNRTTDVEKLPAPLRTALNEASGRTLPSWSLAAIGGTTLALFSIAMAALGYGAANVRHRAAARRRPRAH